MKCSVIVVLAAIGAPAVQASGGDYTYNMTAIDGPLNWANLNISGNACGGLKQSPIVFTLQGCETFSEKYVLSVSYIYNWYITWQVKQAVT